MKEQHDKKWAEYLDLIRLTSNWYDMKAFFAQQSMNASMKKDSKTSYFHCIQHCRDCFFSFVQFQQ